MKLSWKKEKNLNELFRKLQRPWNNQGLNLHFSFVVETKIQILMGTNFHTRNWILSRGRRCLWFHSYLKYESAKVQFFLHLQVTLFVSWLKFGTQTCPWQGLKAKANVKFPEILVSKAHFQNTCLLENLINRKQILHYENKKK